jgi:chromosome partitioning protein
VLATRIPAAADFPEAVAHRKPVTHYKPRSAAAKAVQTLGKEVLARLEARTAADQGEAA